MVDVDVVIATRDRPGPLAACLRALVRQSSTDFGVIVVDDGSTEPVERAIPDDVLRDLDIRVIRRDRSGGPATARNEGVRASEAEYIAFLDDDVWAAPQWLERHREAASKAGPLAVSIGPLAEPPDWEPTPWNEWEAWTLALEYERMRSGAYAPTWRQFHTGNAFLRRELVIQAGGFDETFTRAEDVELAWRLHELGCNFVFEPDAVGWHYARRTLRAWLSIPRSYARFDVTLDRLHPQSGWLHVVQRERAHRHPIVRAARTLFARAPLATPVAWTGAAVAGGLHRLRARRTALRVLSAVYDIQYDVAFNQALREPAPGRGRA